MVGLYCHVFPGIDDGAQNMTDSILMAKQAVGDGIATIVAPPHYHKNVYENTKPTIK